MPNTGSNWISEIRWDERGPYRVYLMDGPGYRAGQKTYVPPAEAVASDDPKLRAWGESNKAPGQSFLRERGTWNSGTGEWDRGINWSNIMSAGVGAAIGAPYLAGLGGGGAAATEFGAPYAASNTAASMAGLPASAALGGVAPAAASGAAAGGNAVLNFLKDNAGALAGIGIPAAAMALSNNGSGGNGEFPEEMKRLLAMAEARTRRADPLHQAAVQMAFGALPNYGRQGISLPTVNLP